MQPGAPSLGTLLLISPLPNVEESPRELLSAVNDQDLGREVQAVERAGLVLLSKLDVAPEIEQSG